MPKQPYRAKRWSLEELIPAARGHELEAAFAELEAAVRGLESKRDLLSPSIPEEGFAELLACVERVGHVERRLSGYATLWLAEDASNQAALALRARVDRALAKARNGTLFFELWWKQLDAASTARLLGASGGVRYYLDTLRRFAPFTLSEPEERVINIKDVHGARALETLYDLITHRLMFEVDVDGEKREMTRGEVMVLVRDARPERREGAYRALHRVFGEHGGLLGQIYTHLVGNWHADNVGLRGIGSPISARNLRNDLEDGVVDALLSSCRANAGLYRRYFRWKAGSLGQRRLRRCDLYAPATSIERRVPFAEGVAVILESLEGFSDVLAASAERVLADDHLDAEVRAGKDTGAFCYGVVPERTPWVLVNYNERWNDVTTLAHELGHAVHAMLASEHSVLTFHACLPLAETASNFAEILLLQRQLDREKAPSVRRHLLASFVDDSYASILRQSYFVLFERDAHRLIVEEGATVDVLCARYLENLREQFGDAVDVPEELRWEWVGVPHLYQVPFYCYAYSFGLLLVLALYRRYEREGAAFIPKYLRMLSRGGSLPPAEILAEAGIDVREEAFWQGGFDVIERMIEELERGAAA